MKVAYVGTYVPRQCGIGTFTANLRSHIGKLEYQGGTGVQDFVIAVEDQHNTYDYPGEVLLRINQQHQQDYIDAAEFINQSGATHCSLQHEYGIYGGDNGIYILSLIRHLKVPLIVTLHTVLKKPSYNERAIMLEICNQADRVVVMSDYAVQLLMECYGIDEAKIAMIHHGVPQVRFSHQEAKISLGVQDKLMILTFGFLGRNKGVETVIKALPQLIAGNPEVVYIVAGKTHPNVLSHAGEEYRDYLTALAAQLGVTDHVVFVNEFVDQQTLFKYLCACDIYITPYVNEAQITSGTLSYAIGAGAAVVSTPYWHAVELLADGRGELFPFKDSVALGKILENLSENPERLVKLKKRSAQLAEILSWDTTAGKYAELMHQTKEHLSRSEPIAGNFDEMVEIVRKTPLPPFSLQHIKRLTDDTGIIQHARYAIPNRREGYCLDDNARVLLLAAKAYEYNRDPYAVELMATSLSYIEHLQNDDGTFRNFLSYDRNYLEDIGSEDAYGRTLWALGYFFDRSPNDAFLQASKELFFKAARHFESIRSIRAIAYTIMGIAHYLKSNPGDEGMTERMRNLTQKIIDNYEAHQTGKWQWFEVLLAYDNGILPLGLLHASEFLNDEKVLDIALESLEFLTRITFKKGHLSIVGNEAWYHRDGEMSPYAQQPLDAMAMVLVFREAFRITQDEKFFAKLYQSFRWFMGENDLGLPLYDHETKGCCDGLEHFGINRNQGAESTLSFLISQLTLIEVLAEEIEPDLHRKIPVSVS